MLLAVDWSAIGGASTAIGVLVALVAVVVQLIATRRSEELTRVGQLEQREQADAAASRSEAAAALTEEYTRRVVLALESMAERGLDAGTVGPAPAVAWSLTHHGGDTSLLLNTGTLRAEHVKVTSHESLGLIWAQEPPDCLEPSEALTFLAEMSLGTKDATITVTWTDSTSDGDPKTWRYPLPPRPARARR